MFTLAGIIDGVMQAYTGSTQELQTLRQSKLHELVSRMDFRNLNAGEEDFHSPESTKVEMCQIIESSHISKYGHLSSGQLLKWVDISACLAAEKLAGRACVTVSVDDLYFEDLVNLGEVVCLRSKVNRAFNTSMEVSVHVTTEDVDGGTKTICKAFLTFVAINDIGKKVKLPFFLYKSPSEEVIYSLAEERKKVRISHSKTMRHLLESYKGETEILQLESPNRPAINGLKTKVESVELVLPQHANHHGNTFGGQVMAWMENVGSISAARFAKREINLRCIDMMHFRGSSHVGDRIVLQAIVNCAFQKSFEVGVRVDAYDCDGGRIGKTRHINSAFFTYETDEELPNLDPTHSEDGIRRHREAVARGKIRLDRRYILSTKRTEKLSVVLDENNLMYLRLNNLGTLSELASKSDWKKVSSVDNLILSTREHDGVLQFKVSKKLCSLKVSDFHAYKILSDPELRIQWDPLMVSCDLVHGERGNEDRVYHTVMRSGINKEAEEKRHDLLLLCSCKKPSRPGDSYIIATRSVIIEGEHRNETDHDRMEVACAGFIIQQEPGGHTEVSYYNETNAKMVSYVTSEVAGFTKLYSVVYKRMEKYIVDKL